SKKDISNKLKITVNLLNEWLKGTKKPTLRKLENLSQILKRPLATFFLSDPPKEKPLPKDYRMIPEKLGKFDNKTILAIRRARRLQRISKELSENLKVNIESEISPANLSDNPKIIAKKYVELFKIDDDVRKKWKTPYNAFNFFRDILENKNVIVFKMPMLLEDARGLTLLDDSPTVIVVNSKDLPEAQVFTLLHEFGHVILNKPGVSIPDIALFKTSVEKVERWCNEFASEILLPQKFAKEHFDRNKGKLVETNTLNSLSRKLKISKAMLLYNMFKMDYINRTIYKSVLERFNPIKLIPKNSKKKPGGGVSADKRCISERGQMFVSLVSKNIDGGYITRSDALDYLAVKSKNLEKVMSKAEK
ncbi:MAG: ImmA/IrrE family metallo-endopeptidase, partial [Nanoarchaeota archaeon]|nr:ImmA/IrrE family metallo-endopeptidase [Nanoarchaeota archaeon]